MRTEFLINKEAFSLLILRNGVSGQTDCFIDISPPKPNISAISFALFKRNAFSRLCFNI